MLLPTKARVSENCEFIQFDFSVISPTTTFIHSEWHKSHQITLVRPYVWVLEPGNQLEFLNIGSLCLSRLYFFKSCDHIKVLVRCFSGTFESLNTFQIKISNSKLDRSHERTCRENHACQWVHIFQVRSLGNMTFVTNAMNYLYHRDYIRISQCIRNEFSKWLSAIRPKIHIPV